MRAIIISVFLTAGAGTTAIAIRDDNYIIAAVGGFLFLAATCLHDEGLRR